MDNDRISGAATEWGGRAKEAAGAISGDASLKIEGLYEQAAGRAENTVGQLKDYAARKPINAVLAAGFIGFLFGVWAGRR